MQIIEHGISLAVTTVENLRNVANQCVVTYQ